MKVSSSYLSALPLLQLVQMNLVLVVLLITKDILLMLIWRTFLRSPFFQGFSKQWSSSSPSGMLHLKTLCKYDKHDAYKAAKSTPDSHSNWQLFMSMTSKSISDLLVLISACDWAISDVIMHNLYHITPRHFLCFSISSVPLIMIHPCSLLVLVPPHRYLCAVCTAPAFIPPVHSSGYY